MGPFRTNNHSISCSFIIIIPNNTFGFRSTANKFATNRNKDFFVNNRFYNHIIIKIIQGILIIRNDFLM